MTIRVEQQIPASLPPSGAAGGDLTGTYPNPTIGAGKVTATAINTALKPSGTAATTDEALRALGTSAGTALAGNAAAGGALAGTYPSPTMAKHGAMWLHDALNTAQAAVVAGEYVGGGSATVVANATTDISTRAFPIVGGDFKSLKLRAQAYTNQTAALVGFTISLRQVTAITGGGTTTAPATLAASVLDLTVAAIAASTLDSVREANLTDLSSFVDGLYVLTITWGSNMAASSRVWPNARILGLL